MNDTVKSRLTARRIAAAIGEDNSGIALTEFAFSLPILLTLILGGLETSNLALAHLRAEGWLRGEVGLGTFVVDEPPIE